MAPATFANAETNFEQYLHFVLERETLRSLKSKSDVMDTKKFASELKITKELNSKLSTDEAKNLTYERMLAHEALFNVLNPYHLFKDPRYSYAIQLRQMIDKYSDKLKKYNILDMLGTEQSLQDGGYYIFTKEKDFDNRLSNLYRSQLEDLANPLISKVPNVEENKLLSDLFEKINIVGFLQMGLSVGKYNITNMLDPSEYLFTVQSKAGEFNKLLDSGDTEKIIRSLDKYKEVFRRLNVDATEKKVFKDYTVKEDILDVAIKSKKKKTKTIKFKVDNVLKIKSGEKTTTLRATWNEDGVYNIGGEFFELKSRGLLTVEEAGGVDAITQSEAFGEDGPKFERTKDFLEGKRKLYVIDIMPSDQVADKLYLQPGVIDNVEFYDSSKSDTEYYERVAEENPGKVFVYGYFLSNVNKKYEYYDQGSLHDTAKEMSVGFPIGETGYVDYFDSFPASRYEELIAVWERKFNEIDSLIADGVTVVFPKNGLATAAMPSELFIYLSNKLAKYGLLNPGSTQYKDVQETLGKVQGISDTEIIEKLGLDKDPFVCPT